MKRVCIESPFKGNQERNTRYARACLRHCINAGVSPYASHLLLTQVLDDNVPSDRDLGIRVGMKMGDSCDERWVFTDLGTTVGMKAAITRAEKIGQPTQIISLGEDWDTDNVT